MRYKIKSQSNFNSLKITWVLVRSSLDLSAILYFSWRWSGIKGNTKKICTIFRLIKSQYTDIIMNGKIQETNLSLSSLAFKAKQVIHSTINRNSRIHGIYFGIWFKKNKTFISLYTLKHHKNKFKNYLHGPSKHLTWIIRNFVLSYRSALS